MLAALAITAWLGVWQYTVAHRNSVQQDVLSAAAKPVTETTQVGNYLAENLYGTAATAIGSIDCSDPVRNSQGWLACPLTLEDGSLIPVVVGLSSTQSNWSHEKVTGEFSGRIQPSQTSMDAPAAYQALPVVDWFGTSDFVLRWQHDVRDGMLALDETSAAIFGLTAVAEAELSFPPQGIDIRNLFYAWQWWLFAAFAIFIWGRFVKDEFNSRLDSTLGPQ